MGEAATVLPVATSPTTLPPAQASSGKVTPTPPAKPIVHNKTGDEVKYKRSEGAACPVWKETGVEPSRLPGPFQKLVLELWPSRNGSSIFEFMGFVLDTWKALDGRGYPPAWVKRKAE